ncbi:MAG: hypothetical protein GKR91_03455 [Pseudomonadales bacterium]|nr:hypothetical protein [Pseudomonadales bacterium]
MRSTKDISAESWVHMATGIAVIIGIMLVIYELEQTRQIAFTEMAQEAMSELNLRDTTLFGEEAAATIAKACFSPTELTDPEKVVLDSVFSSQINFAIRIKLLEDTGGITTIWRRNVQQAVDYIQGFPQGESWMELGKIMWDDEFNEAATAAMQVPTFMSCSERIALLNTHSF